MAPKTYIHRGDLIKRLNGALDFAEAAITLASKEDPGVDLAAFEAPIDKIVAETAIFLRAALRVTSPEAEGIRARADEQVRRLLVLARSRRIELSIALFPALSLDFAVAHLVLSSAGYPDRRFDEIVRTSLRATTANARERSPFLDLEQIWLKSLLDPSTQTRPVCSLPMIDVITGSRDDTYSFTHKLMYATDFGNRRTDFTWPVTQITRVAQSAVAGALDEDDFDLTGELLLTWPYLNMAGCPAFELAFSVLADVENRVGVLPSLAVNRSDYELQTPEAKQNYVAAVTYHTAFVMGLLCAAILSSRRIQRADPSRTANRHLTHYLLDGLQTGNDGPQWLKFVGEMDDDEKCLYHQVYLDAALRRAVRRSDFAAARSLLCKAVESGIAGTVCGHQTAELLGRLGSISTENAADAGVPLTFQR